MSYESCDVFNRLLEADALASQALAAGLKKFLEVNPNIEAVLRGDISAHIAKLQSEDTDAHFQPSDKKQPLPKELRELLRLGIIAISRERSVSPLVADIENKIAGSGHNPKEIFEQTVRLEQALIGGDIRWYHQNECAEKHKELLATLDMQYPALILQADSKKSLSKLVDELFSMPIPKECKAAIAFKVEIESQHEYLCEIGFVKEFYSKKNLAEKFDCAFDKNQTLKETNKRTPELRATFIYLHYSIIEAGYRPVDDKMFELGRSFGATIEDVFKNLYDFANKAWKPYKGSDLLEDLKAKLEDKKDIYDHWSIVRDSSMPKHRRETNPWLSHVHCFKYSFDPNADPRQIVKERGLLPSPVKRKTREPLRDETTQSKKLIFLEPNSNDADKNATQHTMPARDNQLSLVDLFCDETLDFDSQPETKKSKKLGIE